MKSRMSFSDLFRAVIFACLAFAMYHYNLGDGAAPEKVRYVVSEGKR